jgi:dTMP kinase
MHRAVCNNVQPDLTLLLLPPLADSLNRARRRNQRTVQRHGTDENRFETEGDEFYTRIYTSYEAIARREPQRVVTLRDQAPIEIIAAAIKQIVAGRLGISAAAAEAEVTHSLVPGSPSN